MDPIVPTEEVSRLFSSLFTSVRWPSLRSYPEFSSCRKNFYSGFQGSGKEEGCICFCFFGYTQFQNSPCKMPGSTSGIYLSACRRRKMLSCMPTMSARRWLSRCFLFLLLLYGLQSQGLANHIQSSCTHSRWDFLITAWLEFSALDLLCSCFHQVKEIALRLDWFCGRTSLRLFRLFYFLSAQTSRRPFVQLQSSRLCPDAEGVQCAEKSDVRSYALSCIWSVYFNRCWLPFRDAIKDADEAWFCVGSTSDSEKFLFIARLCELGKPSTFCEDAWKPEFAPCYAEWPSLILIRIRKRKYCWLCSRLRMWPCYCCWCLPPDIACRLFQSLLSNFFLLLSSPCFTIQGVGSSMLLNYF